MGRAVAREPVHQAKGRLAFWLNDVVHFEMHLFKIRQPSPIMGLAVLFQAGRPPLTTSAIFSTIFSILPIDYVIIFCYIYSHRFALRYRNTPQAKLTPSPQDITAPAYAYKMLVESDQFCVAYHD